MNWPDSLPNPILSDFSETFEPNNIETTMLSGRTFLRRRFSKNTLTTNMSFIFNDEQKQTFENFFRDTLLNGTKEFEFLSKKRIIVGGIESVPYGGRYYKITFKTESYV